MNTLDENQKRLDESGQGNEKDGNTIQLPEQFKYLLLQLEHLGQSLDVAISESQLRTVAYKKYTVSVGQLMDMLQDLNNQTTSSILQMVNVVKDISERPVNKINKAYVDSRISLMDEAIRIHLQQIEDINGITVADPMVPVDPQLVNNLKEAMIGMHQDYLQQILDNCEKASSLLEREGQVDDAPDEPLMLTLHINFEHLTDKMLVAFNELQVHIEAQNKVDDVTQLVFEGLSRIQTRGGEENFVIFHFSPQVYIQFAGERGNPELRAEAVGNAYLPKPYQLDRGQVSRLISLGWKGPYESGNHFQAFRVENDLHRIQVARLVVNTAKEVYGVTPSVDMDVEVNLE